MFTSFSVTGSSLELLKTGDRGIVKSCKIPDRTVLKRLTALGLTIGTTITVEQDFPALIIQVGSILLEIEKEVARTIYIRLIH